MTALLLEFDEVAIVTPEAQNALVEIFRVLELVMHKAPSNALVFRIVRDDCKLPFPDAEGKALLAKFRNARPGGAPVTHLARTAPAPGIERERASSAPDAPLVRAEAAGATRAGDKVFLVPNTLESSSAAASVYSLSMQFGMWFLEAGITAGAIPAHIRGAATPTGYAYANDKFAQPLVSEYGIDECKQRAERLFARCTLPANDRRRIHVDASIKMLGEWWSGFKGETPRTLAVVPPPNESDFQRRNREGIERRLGAAK